MSGHPLLRCTVYTVIAVFAMSACGERTGPLEPTLSRLETSPASARGDSHAKILKRSKALKGDLQATATVTPNGGTLAIPDAGLLVVFPRGAVSRNLVVTVEAHGGKDLVYSFEPHGTHFSQPIEIESKRPSKLAITRPGPVAIRSRTTTSTRWGSRATTAVASVRPSGLGARSTIVPVTAACGPASAASTRPLCQPLPPRP